MIAMVLPNTRYSTAPRYGRQTRTTTHSSASVGCLRSKKMTPRIISR